MDSSTELPTFASLLASFAWPIAVIALVFILRVPLSRIAAGLGSRVTSVGYGKFKIELAPVELTPIRPDWVVDGEDVGGLSSEQVFDSHSISLFEQLAKDTQADYVVLDLRDGKAWLTSRLYIFAVVLGRVRGVRAFVFVANRDIGSNGFVGFAAPEDIQRKLAANYPLFESALLDARTDHGTPLVQGPTPDPKDLLPVYTPLETAEPHALQSITHQYVHKVQSKTLPPGATEDEWLYFVNKYGEARYELARWITPHRLEAILGDALKRAHFIDSPDLGKEARAAKILRRKGDLVARLDEGRRFEDLIDRRAFIEKLAPEIANDIDR